MNIIKNPHDILHSEMVKRLANKNKLWMRYPGFEYSNDAAQERKDKV